MFLYYICLPGWGGGKVRPPSLIEGGMPRGGHKDFLPPPQKNIMMFIKLLVLIGFDLHFPLISGIYKLNLIKASYLSAFTLFYILHYSHSFYINYKDL